MQGTKNIMVKEPMKITYLCERCGAIIGSMKVQEEELAMLDIDPLTVDMRADIIKSNETGDLFIYTLCHECVETMSLHETEMQYLRAPDLH